MATYTLNAIEKTITTEWNEEYVNEANQVVSQDCILTESYKGDRAPLKDFIYGRLNHKRDTYIIIK